MPTKTEMLANVRSRLADASTVRFSDNEVKAWLLKGYQRVVRLLQAHRLPPLHLHPTDAVSVYNLSSFASDDATVTGAAIYRPERMMWKTATDTVATPLQHITYRDLLRIDPAPEFATAGTPAYWCMLSPVSVMVYPPPAVAGGAQHFLYLQGLSIPTVWADGDAPILSTDHQDLIELWTCATMIVNTINDEGNEWRASAFGHAFWDGINLASTDNMWGDGTPRLGSGSSPTAEFRFDFEANNSHLTG